MKHFLENLDLEVLFGELGLSDLNTDERKLLEEKIVMLLEERIITRIGENLSDEQVDALAAAADEDWAKMMLDAGVDIEEIAFEESVLLRAELVKKLGDA